MGEPTPVRSAGYDFIKPFRMMARFLTAIGLGNNKLYTLLLRSFSTLQRIIFVTSSLFNSLSMHCFKFSSYCTLIQLI